MMLRAFIAVEIPVEIQNAIADNTASLRSALPSPLVRWVARQNVHLTLKFLGDVSPDNLKRLAETLKVESGSLEPFDISVAGLGAFPSQKRARVIWIGLDAPPALLTLQHEVDAVAAQLGYPREERPFSPHLTIGRVAQNASASDLQRIRTALEAVKVGVLGSAHVQAIHIFKSDLRPGGSVYSLLYTLSMRST
ncbi:MAG TPA: RNA 2',3'-cyclic phosphodiesterase [Anaerolineales bacterium]|nr:RNA 2',3'-cyclic phosphodiesterase [Anaerolineales bacterium]